MDEQIPLAGMVTAPGSDAERAAACALAGLSGIGMASLALIRKHHGSLAAAVDRGGDAVAATPDLRETAAKSLREAGDLARRGQWLLERSRALGLQILFAGDEAYPGRLARAKSHPPVLYVLGAIPSGRAVAVVGARKSDTYGLDQARAIAERLVGSGVTVVSGGATGIDTAAHQRTLELDGKTVAVLGTGLDSPDVKKQQGWCERLARRGAVVSEFALDAGGNTNHFPQRNRTLAGLSEAIIFARGTAESGALTTCEAAARAGRPVFVVPGRVGDALSEGPNGLLFERRAFATRDGAEVLLHLGLKAEEPATSAPREPEVALEPEARRVLDALGKAPLHVDEVAEIAGLSAHVVSGLLLELELAGLCVARPGKYFLRR